jgi:hypothetical protein
MRVESWDLYHLSFPGITTEQGRLTIFEFSCPTPRRTRFDNPPVSGDQRENVTEKIRYRLAQEPAMNQFVLRKPGDVPKR